ncbi:hypothetical protein BD309DRAFT_969180, partial [Dichomitus squalens]
MRYRAIYTLSGSCAAFCIAFGFSVDDAIEREWVRRGGSLGSDELVNEGRARGEV